MHFCCRRRRCSKIPTSVMYFVGVFIYSTVMCLKTNEQFFSRNLNCCFETLMTAIVYIFEMIRPKLVVTHFIVKLRASASFKGFQWAWASGLPPTESLTPNHSYLFFAPDSWLPESCCSAGDGHSTIRISSLQFSASCTGFQCGCTSTFKIATLIHQALLDTLPATWPTTAVLSPTPVQKDTVPLTLVRFSSFGRAPTMNIHFTWWRVGSLFLAFFIYSDPRNNKPGNRSTELFLYKLIIDRPKSAQDSFSNVAIVLRICLVLMVTNCSSERFTSKLKINENRRTSMTQGTL